MNKQALVEFVRVSLLKQEAVADNQKTLHYQRVAQAVGYAFDTLLSQSKEDVGVYYVKHYYKQPVHEYNGYRYVSVFDGIVPVGEGKGIWYVQPSGGGKPFANGNRPSVAMFRNLPIGTAMRETFWRLGNLADETQIVLENIGDSPYKDIRQVDYGVVRNFDSYEDTEEIRIPDGRMDLLEQMCMQWLQGTYSDKINNNQ